MNHIVNKVAKQLVFCIRQDNFSSQALRTLQYSLIYQNLNYGNIIQGNTYPSRLESIRKIKMKIIRMISFSDFRDHKRPLFQILSILPIDDLKNEAIALFGFKFFTKLHPATFNHFFKSNDYFHRHNTRSLSKIHKEQIRKNYKTYSVKFKGCEIWNNLSVFIKT